MKQGTEKIELVACNIHGQALEKGFITFDFDNNKVITQSGKIFNIVPDNIWTYKFQKTEIRASGGINGLYQFINEINQKNSAFNPSRTIEFINL